MQGVSFLLSFEQYNRKSLGGWNRFPFPAVSTRSVHTNAHTLAPPKQSFQKWMLPLRCSQIYVCVDLLCIVTGAGSAVPPIWHLRGSGGERHWVLIEKGVTERWNAQLESGKDEEKRRWTEGGAGEEYKTYFLYFLYSLESYFFPSWTLICFFR